MSNLAKATLQEIGSDEQESPIGEPVAVQFNPASLSLQVTNQIEGNRSRGRQVRQYTGSSSSTLTLDLIFDTADEGTTDTPRSVREKTALVEKYVLPKGDGDQKQAPPKLQFQWGGVLVKGVVENVSIDFDHFASDGTPLRAKVNLSIKEQDARYQFGSTGPMANQQGGTPDPGIALPGFPGTSSGNAGNRSAPSLAGESAAEFAARVGIDAEAWRGLSLGGGDALSLSAGLEIGFSAGLNLNAGVGMSAGVEIGLSSSAEAAFGLAADGAEAARGVNGEVATGFQLSAAGGVDPAIQSVAVIETQRAEQKAREAFGVARPETTAAPTRPGLPEQQRAPMAETGSPAPARRRTARPAPTSRRADARSTSFGAGVPLRPRLGGSGAEAGGSGEPPMTEIPTTAPWVALPALDSGRQQADRAENRLRPKRPCGCHGPCGHRGGK